MAALPGEVKPKPLLPLVEGETQFEQAVSRCGDAGRFAAPVVVTGTAHLEHVEMQLGATDGAQVIVEPAAKSTAAPIALAAARLP